MFIPLFCTYSELEEEMERVRSFYTKKVEDVQRKSESQIRALKRGGPQAQSEEASPTRAHVTSREGFPTGNNLQSQVAPPPLESHQQAHVAQQVQQVTVMYAERLALLEKELMSTAEELGRVKAAALSAKDGHSQPPRPSFLPQPGFSAPIVPGGHPAFPAHFPMHMHVPQGPHMHHPGYGAAPGPPLHEGAQVGERERAAHERTMAELKTQHTAHVEQLSTQWTNERDSLQKRLREEEERCATLRQELMAAVRGAAFSAPAQQVSHTTQVEMKSPELKQFLVSFLCV